MLKRRASLLRFLCILGQAGVFDRSEHVGAIFSNVLHFSQQRKLHALSPPVVQKSAQIINCGGVCYCACSISEIAKFSGREED